jgi:PPOX class probable F420-dependent enzyme
MARLTDAQVEFLREPNYAVVATLRPDGTPHQTVVWVDTDGENVVFNTNTERAKPRYLERRPYASVLVLDRDDPYRWLAVDGPVEVTEENAEVHIDALALKYRGDPSYDLGPGEQRLVCTVRPHRVTPYGLDG